MWYLLYSKIILHKQNFSLQMVLNKIQLGISSFGSHVLRSSLFLRLNCSFWSRNIIHCLSNDFLYIRARILDDFYFQTILIQALKPLLNTNIFHFILKISLFVQIVIGLQNIIGSTPFPYLYTCSNVKQLFIVRFDSKLVTYLCTI